MLKIVSHRLSRTGSYRCVRATGRAEWNLNKFQKRTIKHLVPELHDNRCGEVFPGPKRIEMDPQVADLLRTHAAYLQLRDGRVVCSLNDHSLPPTAQAIETFVK